jgi:hypothetical protein
MSEMRHMQATVTAVINGSPRQLNVTIEGGPLKPEEIPGAIYVVGEALKQGAIEAAKEPESEDDKALKLTE